MRVYIPIMMCCNGFDPFFLYYCVKQRNKILEMKHDYRNTSETLKDKVVKFCFCNKHKLTNKKI